MTSLVEIYNRALGQVAARSTIASQSELTTEARTCNSYFPGVRDTVLRAANWSFATKNATLSLLKAAAGTPENPEPSTSAVWTTAYPPPPWLYSYAYPSDAIRVQTLKPQVTTLQGVSPPIFPTTFGAVPFVTTAMGGKFVIANDQDTAGNDLVVVLADVSQAIGVYTRRITETSVWPEDFIAAVVFGLAGYLATALSGDKRQMQLLWQKADQILIQARRNDANEGLEVQGHVPDWMSARGVTWLPGTPGIWYAPYGPLFAGAL